ncbi:hypothetical protein RA210_U50165 [Rubrivivax sp. A210]|nr:hypothetical protein RA210_U50165 [Rubrivivax sp. A210]
MDAKDNEAHRVIRQSRCVQAALNKSAKAFAAAPEHLTSDDAKSAIAIQRSLRGERLPLHLRIRV